MKLTAKELKDRLDGDELDLSMMSLAVVPVKELLPLKRATSLDLSCNALDGIPDAFCDLVHLVKLDLSQNRIASLPAQLGRLANLEHLDLYKNQLQELPISLAQMKRLKWLDVKENPLSPDLAKVAGDCLDAKQCGAAASRMVAHMGAVQSELERERQRRLRTEREAASAAAAVAERERMEAKAARKADKERRKAAAKANAAAKTPSNGASNGHGGAQSGKTAKGGAKKEKKSQGRGLLMGCLCGLIGLVFNCLMLCGIFVLATAGLLYLNCRNGPGGVFVRGSAKLCTEMDAWVTNGVPPKLDTVHTAAAGLRYEVSDKAAWLASRDYAALAAQAVQTTKTAATNAALWVQHKSVPAAKAFYKDSGKHATAASKFLLAKTQDAAVAAKKLSYQAYQLSLDLAQRAQRSVEGYLNQKESPPPKEAKSSKSPPPSPKESKTQRNA